LSYLTSIAALAKKLSRRNYDIIHAHHTYCIYPIKIATVLAAVKLPLILTFHEGEVHQHDSSVLENIDFIKRLVFFKRPKRMALKMADLVIAVQAEMLDQLDFIGKSIILPCGVDSERFRPLDQKSCREKLNLPLDKKIVFFPASPNNKQKGFDLLEESVNRLNRDDLLLLAAGNLLHDDMPYYMNAADVVVQLSEFEASPSVLKEALAVNVPVVFTGAGDAKKIIDDTRGCFLCDRRPADVAAKLDQALRFDGACTGRKRIFATGLTNQAISKELIQVYADILC
jgi:glycosyltransferase involved in cell wall biosynthesis